MAGPAELQPLLGEELVWVQDVVGVQGGLDAPHQLHPGGAELPGQEGGLQAADGSFMMRSPFTPAGLGGPAQLLPVDVSIMWQYMVAARGDKRPGLLIELLFFEE